MKNKILKVLMILLVCIMTCTLSSCKAKFNSSVSKIEKSMKDVMKITSTVTVKDNEIIVYEYLKTLEINDANAKVSMITKKLNSNFVLEEKSNSQTVENINKKELFKLNLDIKLVSEYETPKNKLIFTVSKDNIAKIFNVEKFDILDNANFEFTYQKKKVTNMKCTFKTISSKDVEINVVYEY